MRIRPRQQLLEIWRSLLAESYRDGEWLWPDPKGNDSVADAQQLLCLMLPPVEMDSLRFSHPDRTFDDVLKALRPLGGAVEIPGKVLSLLIVYLERHRDDAGPVFDGAGYLVTTDSDGLTPEDSRLDTVEGFALSVTLTLASLTFAREFRRAVTRPETNQRLDRLEELAGERLTAALVGLIRSFAIDVFDVESSDGETLLGMLNQSDASASSVAKELRERLREVTAGLPTLRLAEDDPIDLNDTNRLYQVGWSWGVVADKPKLDFLPANIPQRDGVAFSGVYLYFTVVAMDGLVDLFSSSTRLLGLLNDEQQRLAQALRERWQLTQRYWSILASFGRGQWPLEDLPWTTVDKVEHDYFSLLVTSITLRDLASRQVAGPEVMRLAAVLRELGNRSRITRRPLAADPAVAVHTEGILLGLDKPTSKDTDPEQKFGWQVADFAALLLKRTVRVLQLTTNPELRRNMLSFLDQVWEHVLRRKLGQRSGKSLWDRPANVFDVEAGEDGPMWQPTLRIVESLVQAAELVSAEPVRSREVGQYAHAMLSEAEHLYDQEILRGGSTVAPTIQRTLNEVLARMNRVQAIIDERPATATALLQRILEDLDGLSAPRDEPGD